MQRYSAYPVNEVPKASAVFCVVCQFVIWYNVGCNIFSAKRKQPFVQNTPTTAASCNEIVGCFLLSRFWRRLLSTNRLLSANLTYLLIVVQRYFTPHTFRICIRCMPPVPGELVPSRTIMLSSLVSYKPVSSNRNITP